MDTRKWVVNKQYIRNGNYKLLDELVSEYYRLEDENKRLRSQIKQQDTETIPEGGE